MKIPNIVSEVTSYFGLPLSLFSLEKSFDKAIGVVQEGDIVHIASYGQDNDGNHTLRNGDLDIIHESVPKVTFLVLNAQNEDITAEFLRKTTEFNNNQGE